MSKINLCSGPHKEGQKVKFGFPSQSFKVNYPKGTWKTRNKFPSCIQDKEALHVPSLYPDGHQFSNNFFMQRKSAPNIHNFSESTFNAASFKKRHSFQDGVKYFSDKVRQLFIIDIRQVTENLLHFMTNSS